MVAVGMAVAIAETATTMAVQQGRPITTEVSNAAATAARRVSPQVGLVDKAAAVTVVRVVRVAAAQPSGLPVAPVTAGSPTRRVPIIIIERLSRKIIHAKKPRNLSGAFFGWQGRLNRHYF